MTRYVVANWKSHKTLPEAERWLEEFLRFYRPDPEVIVIVAPAFVHLVPLWRLVRKLEAAGPALAVQDLSPFPLGAYTGAVAAEMVRGVAGYAIVGHAERRRYFHETSQEIANKVSEAAAAGIAPIVCVDLPCARAQLTALDGADTEGLIIGYGPVEAIGVDIPQSLGEAGRAVGEIRAILPGKPILYGGSIRAANAADYLGLEGVSGLMVGSASLSPTEFAEICETASRF